MVMRTAVYLMLLVGVAGCHSRPIFDWGSYEASISWLYGENYDLGRDIERLEKEVRRTESAADLVVPPGKYLHLGYLYLKAGNERDAVRCFEAEKNSFPESAQFVDFALEKVQPSRRRTPRTSSTDEATEPEDRES